MIPLLKTHLKSYPIISFLPNSDRLCAWDFLFFSSLGSSCEVLGTLLQCFSNFKGNAWYREKEYSQNTRLINHSDHIIIYYCKTRYLIIVWNGFLFVSSVLSTHSLLHFVKMNTTHLLSCGFSRSAVVLHLLYPCTAVLKTWKVKSCSHATI